MEQPSGQSYTLDHPAACEDTAGAAMSQITVTADKLNRYTYTSRDGGTVVVTAEHATGNSG